MPILDVRILGPLSQFPVSTSGGGGDLTINNNTSGYMLKATGGASTISGVGEIKFDGSNLEITTDLYVKSSGNNLFLDGTNDEGSSTKYRIEIVGGMLRATPVN